MTESTKTCPKCNVTKVLSDFYEHKIGRQAGQPSSYCKPCMALYNNRYHADHMDDIRARVVKHRYGLSQEDLALLSNDCAICGSLYDLHIDHDHETGKVRDLLCGRCNRGLGMFKDDPNLLIRATDYILNHLSK